MLEKKKIMVHAIFVQLQSINKSPSHGIQSNSKNSDEDVSGFRAKTKKIITPRTEKKMMASVQPEMPQKTRY